MNTLSIADHTKPTFKAQASIQDYSYSQKISCYAFLLILILGCLYWPNSFAGPEIYIADFARENINQWESKSFVGETRYQIVQQGKETVLQAHSQNSASGLAKPIKIDLKKTPYLYWSWKIEAHLENLTETEKSGDDYAARVYVVIDGGWQLWKTKALNYVWSSNQAKGSRWDNAFAGSSAKMIAIKGKEDALTWHREKRNVYQDLIAAFGDKGSAKANEKAYRHIDAIAIMTDTDNSERSIKAWYGDIYFSDK